MIFVSKRAKTKTEWEHTKQEFGPRRINQKRIVTKCSSCRLAKAKDRMSKVVITVPEDESCQIVNQVCVQFNPFPTQPKLFNSPREMQLQHDKEPIYMKNNLVVQDNNKRKPAKISCYAFRRFIPFNKKYSSSYSLS